MAVWQGEVAEVPGSADTPRTEACGMEGIPPGLRTTEILIGIPTPLTLRPGRLLTDESPLSGVIKLDPTGNPEPRNALVISYGGSEAGCPDTKNWP